MSSVIRQEPLWQPTQARLRDVELARFMRWAGERRGRAFADYEQLWRWSVEELEQFWESVWEFCGVRASRPYERVLGAREMPGARWFEGARLNYAENLLAHGEGRGGELAVAHCSELRPALAEISWATLRERVAAAASGMRALGVAPGDRVAAYMPNIPETLIALLASASIGAIWSSAAPEFGARSVIDRFAQIEPKLLLSVDGYRHGGKDFDRTVNLGRILEELPSVEHVVVLEYLADDDDFKEAACGGGAGVRSSLTWDQLLALGEGADLHFEQVPFDHPLWVLYSSGTTGLPKAIVHGHGGILLEQVKKRLHLDLRAGDRMFWFTTTGWMMWNFLVGCLISDAAIVLYDGSPGYPSVDFLWDLAERARITCMGVSPGLLASCEKAGIEPGGEHDLSRLRALGATGSPLSPESFRWVYEHVKSDLWLFSTSGGTDVCTAFVAGCPLLPVYEGELQCRALGCAVESWDEQGNSLSDEVGELVITRPMPSMPLYLWGDDDPAHPGERLRESYFAMYPGVWRHGDWIRITPRGGAVIYGRSDSTINRQGVRMGTAEIYRAALGVPEVLDALVVDLARPRAAGSAAAPPAARAGGGDGLGGELWMVMFVVLRDGATLDEELVAQIKRRIREDCSPRHVPNEIRQIEEVPRTLSGKVLEVPVKRILMGAPPERAASADSLSNPRALDYFVELARELGSSALAR
ncbi:MAG TPA: acetoacetate--CoA ligase [Solirubrobacteraceae bacterium]|nr:acetoacetate--CoA ligase [Solirubrobacteraceae bacterium]